MAGKSSKSKKSTTSRDGSEVGYLAKCQSDCRWNATRVAFYIALKKIGGTGTAPEISKASGGKVSVGNALNYGYHGAFPGYNKVEQQEDVRGFTFTITAKGKAVNLDKILEKPAKAEKAAK